MAVEDLFTMPDFGNEIGLTILIISIGAAWYGVNYLIDKRYPKVKFLVFNEGIVRIMTLRTDGQRVVDASPLGLLLGKARPMEELLIDFQKLLMYAGPFNSGAIYVSTEVKGTLLPIGVNLRAKNKDGIPYIQPSEIATGLQIALRKMEADRWKKMQMRGNEMFLQGIAYNIPFILIALLFTATFYFMNAASIEAAMHNLEVQQQISQNLAAIINYYQSPDFTPPDAIILPANNTG